MSESPRREYFTFLATCWDVTAAQEIAKDGRRPYKAAIGDLIGWLGLPESDNDGNAIGLVRVDKEYAMTTDLSEPFIVVQHPQAGNIPIDGWHRIYHAWKTGQDVLPFYLLNEAEEARVRVDPRRVVAHPSAGVPHREPQPGPEPEF
jgi:hypothetical protein